VNLNTKRQVGSTIKPLLYCFAIDNGFSPCGSVSTAPQVFPTMDKPYDANMKGETIDSVMTMSHALALSINNAALYVLKQVGIEPFVDFAHKCGISSRIEPYPAVALGVSDISLFEMLGAYSMFPSGGMHSEPFFLSKIEDKNGTLLKSFSGSQKEIINHNTAFKMVKMMRGVMNAGTGGRLRGRYHIYNDVAGKTGTTNNQADAWFIGYTPQLLAGAWVGCDDREFRFRSERLGQGASAALPIWAFFMKRVYADKKTGIIPSKMFEQPKDFDNCETADTAATDNYYNDKTKRDVPEIEENAGPPTIDYNE
jgi:penicillin-binding protein 1A